MRQNPPDARTAPIAAAPNAGDGETNYTGRIAPHPLSRQLPGLIAQADLAQVAADRLEAEARAGLVPWRDVYSARHRARRLRQLARSAA